jgi:hypothetical protein
MNNNYFLCQTLLIVFSATAVFAASQRTIVANVDGKVNVLKDIPSDNCFGVKHARTPSASAP